jgi:hypothetical protein
MKQTGQTRHPFKTPHLPPSFYGKFKDFLLWEMKYHFIPSEVPEPATSLLGNNCVGI